MYTLAQENGHVVWKEQWYALTSRISLRANLYMTRKDQVFVTNVMVIDLTWKMVDSSGISKLANATAKFSTIVKIHKYRRLHERHHFIPMVMDMHIAPKRVMDHFIKDCVCLFHDK